MTKTLENYCECCKRITTWTPETIEIRGNDEDMYKCLGSSENCPHYSTREYLKIMQEKMPKKKEEFDSYGYFK